jgi:hypothetical protein
MGPDSSLCHKAYQKHNQANLYVNFGPHKHHSNQQATTQYVCPVYVMVPKFICSLNMCIICTHYVAQCWEQVPPEFGITQIVMERLEQVEIFDFQLPRHGSLVGRTL